MSRTMKETRDRVAPDEVLDAWETLYAESGPPTVEDIAGWLGATREATTRFWPKELVIDGDDVVHHESDDLSERTESDEDPMGASTCPECGAPPGEECDCVALDDEGPGVGLVPEGKVGFDKFMDRILVCEGAGRPPVPEEDNPQRRRAARHQDRPNNRIRYGVTR